jgi:hypothetical protein
MVTRRAVLKGTAAASIGAIAAAHGAVPAEAASLDAGYGQLAGGAIGAFYKERDAFQIALKFYKAAAEVFFKEDVGGGVSVFFKFFDKARWSTVVAEPLDARLFPDLKTSDLYFSKIHPAGAELFLKNDLNNAISGQVDVSAEGVFFKFDVLTPEIR